MAFSINDTRPPLEQFLQGEAARAYQDPTLKIGTAVKA